MRPRIFFALAFVMLVGCASAPHGGMGHSEAALATQPVMTLPVCGFEAPYLPNPCRMEVTKGEWLEIRNPSPKPAKHHSWLWWFLIAGVL